MVNRCILCKDNEESIDHILIHCDKTRVLWTFLLVVFSLKWVFLVSVKNLFLEWKFKELDKKRRIVWHVAPICLFWCIWKEHNQRIFNNEELLDQRLKKFFIKSLLEWSHASLKMEKPSNLHFLDALPCG